MLKSAPNVDAARASRSAGFCRAVAKPPVERPLPLLPRVALGIGSVDTGDMSIEAWWPRLRQQSRDYLIDNNGDVVPPDLVEEIARAGGVITSEAWWVGPNGTDGLFLSDEAIDWIDEIANGETPAPRAEDGNPTS